MKCPQAHALIMRLLDQALEGADQKRLEAHLVTCPDCRGMQAELLGISQALARMPVVEAPAGLESRVLGRVRAFGKIPVEGAGRFITTLYVALSLAALMLAGVLTLGEAGLLEFFFTRTGKVFGVLENAWNLQIAYQLLDRLLSQEFASLVSAAEAVLAAASLSGLLVGMKFMLPARPAYEKAFH